jgi:hypothetical protein
MLQYGIPHVHFIIKCDIPEWEVETWGIFGTISLNSWFLFHPDGTSEMTKPEKLLK